MVPTMGIDGETEAAAKTAELAIVTEDCSPAQLFALQMIADHAKPHQILASIRRQKPAGHEHITQKWLYCLSSVAVRPERYKPIIERLRAEQPLLDGGFRMKKRLRALEIAEADQSVSDMLAVLDGVERLVGPEEARNAPQHQTNVQINLGDVSEARRRIEAMKAGAGGRSPIMPAGTADDVIEGDALP